jgi:ribose transport system ATP-binding protein
MTDRAPAPHVAVDMVSKRFGGVQALAAVSVVVSRGSIHALVGENGAGKSTLGKIVGGVLAPDEGDVWVDGQKVSYRAPREAARDGIVSVAQELRLLPRRSVAENVFLGCEPRGRGVYSRAAVLRRFADLAARAGMPLPPEQMAGSLGIAQQQEVEILHALARDPKVLILDEPTAALTRQEISTLFQTLERLKAGGTTIIYVSHFLEEVLEICDTITVLRDGHVVRTGPAADETPATLIEGMVGRPIGLRFPAKRTVAADAPSALSANGICGGRVKDATLDVRCGEVVGVAGLMGSGRSTLARLMFGAERMTGGHMRVAGEAARLRSPRQAVARNIAMVPESRKTQGLLMHRAVRENLSLVYGADATRWKIISRNRERRMHTKLMQELDVRGDLKSRARTLSGGNQQKVVLAKWLWRQPHLLIVDEPGRGVDVVAKQAMYRLIDETARAGAGVLLVSSDVEEIVGLSDQVLVMREGRIVARLAGDAVRAHAVVAASFGEYASTSRKDRP